MLHFDAIIMFWCLYQSYSYMYVYCLNLQKQKHFPIRFQENGNQVNFFLFVASTRSLCQLVYFSFVQNFYGIQTLHERTKRKPNSTQRNENKKKKTEQKYDPP